MLSLAILVLLILFAQHLVESFRWQKTSQRVGKLLALNQGVAAKIEELRLEYRQLEQLPLESDEIKSRKRELKVIVECAAALQEIDNDLAIFKDHLLGDDEKLRQTAEVFSREFKDCKKEIESNLNKIVAQEQQRSS